jgi:hypothetical protein
MRARCSRVYPSNWLVGGDFTNLDEVIYNAEDPDFFDFASLLPDTLPGGQSIYGAYFDDENYDLKHTGPGRVDHAQRRRRRARAKRVSVYDYVGQQAQTRR